MKPDELEERMRRTLHSRAGEIEPAADAYARLADRATAASGRQAWWRGPQMLWAATAGGMAALLVVLGVLVFSGDDSDSTATDPTQPTPAQIAEPTPDGSESPTTDAVPTPTSLPVVSSAPPVIWPVGAPDDSWPASADQAVARFYEDVFGLIDVPLALLDVPEGSGFVQILAFGNADLTDVGDEVANFVLVEAEPGRWGIAEVSSQISIEPPLDRTREGLRGLDLTVFAEGIDGEVSVRVVGTGGLLLADGSVVVGPEGLGTTVIDTVDAPTYTGPGVVIAWGFPPDRGAPAVALTQVEIAPGDSVETEPPPLPEGPPAGVMWPVETQQPFGEWPNRPEEAAQQFVTSVGGWRLPIGSISPVDPAAGIVDVQLQSIDEEGNPFGTAATVRVIGATHTEGLEQWGVLSVRSDMIIVDRTFYDGNDFLVSGLGWAFEGVIDVRLVDSAGSVAGEGFLMGGGVELRPLEGTVPLTESLPGPGFAVFSDVGGLGVAPIALTVTRIELPELRDNAAPGETCSAEGLEPPEPDSSLPDAVEATRQAIATAAVTCDWAALDLLIDESAFSYSFGGGNDPVGFWHDAEATGGEPMRFLVETLKLAWVLDSGGGFSGEDLYIWPDVFVLPWHDVVEAQKDALRPLYGDDDFDSFARIGGFAGFRLAITSAGDWVYFIAGD